MVSPRLSRQRWAQGAHLAARGAEGTGWCVSGHRHQPNRLSRGKAQQWKGLCSGCSLPGFARCLLDAGTSLGRQRGNAQLAQSAVAHSTHLPVLLTSWG